MSADDDGTLDNLTTMNPARSVREGARAMRVPTLTILFHPDVARVGQVAPLPSLRWGEAVDVSRLTPEFRPLEGGVEQGIRDPFLSRDPVRITMSGQQLEIDASGTRTAAQVDGAPCKDTRTLPIDALDRGVVMMLSGRVVLLLHWRDARPGRAAALGLIGGSDAMAAVRRQIREVASHEVPVLIQGASGTGKELVARAIHDCSQRRGRYVSVNMAAIPPEMAASALFGHSRGAFTGAKEAKEGYFGVADGGTLFLDEIGDTPAAIQPAMLRALESGEIQPVGADMPRMVNARIIAATDADLAAAVSAGTFRRPLLHRLSVFEIEMPPLRERRDDIARLFIHFLREELETIGRVERLAAPSRGEEPWLSAELLERLTRHDWPGNVRELRNMARSLVIRSSSQRHALGGEQLLALSGESSGRWTREACRDVDDGEAVTEASTPRRRTNLDDISDEAFIAVFRRNRFMPGRTASELGLSRNAVYALITRHPDLRQAMDIEADELREVLKSRAGDVAETAMQLGVSKRALQHRMTALGIH